MYISYVISTSLYYLLNKTMTKRYFYLIYLLLFFYGSAAAQTVVLNAVADNTIYNDLTNNSNGAGENFTAGTTCGSAIRRGLIRFDLSSIPAGATINSASLRLTVNKTVSGAANMSLHRLNAAWGEGSSDAGTGADGQGVVATAGDVTWACSFANGSGGCTTGWSDAGGNFNPSVSATASVAGIGNYTWSGTTLTADVQNMMNNAAENFGWIIKMDNETITCSAKRFASRTSSVVANRPILTVNYTTVAPINLAYFTARAQQYGSLMVWETLQETNAAFFELQHSIDGQNFRSIGTVAAAGNSTVPLRYSFTHQDATAGRNFYRLVQQDISGQRYSSSIERVDVGAKSPRLFIAPNPVGNKLVLPGLDASGDLRYCIISIDGKQVAAGIIRNQTIDLPTDLKPGVYRFQLLAPDGSLRSASFLKQ